MGNIVQTFTIAGIKDALERAEASTPEDTPIQRLAIGFDTLNLTRDLVNRGALGDALGTKRTVDREYSVPTGYVRCYTGETEYFEVKVNSAKPADSAPIVTGGSTPAEGQAQPATVTWGESVNLIALKSHLQVAEANLSQARRLVDRLSMPD